MRQLLGFALKAAVSALLLYIAFSRVSLQAIGPRLQQLDHVWLAAAIVVLIAQTALGALRWWIIIAHCAGPERRLFPVATALRYAFIAAFFNQTLPSTVGGDAVRVWLLARDQHDWRMAAYSVLIDRLVGVLMLALLVMLGLPWSFALIGNAAGRIALLLVGFGSIAACLVFLAFGVVHWPWLERWWLTRQITTAATVARGVLASPSDRAPLVVYSLLIHLLSVTAAWCLAKSAAVPLPWGQALVLILPVLLIATIPLSIAGWGTRETAMVLAFGYAGLSEGDGLIVSVLLGIAAFAAGLIGGLVWILDRGRQLRERRQPAQ